MTITTPMFYNGRFVALSIRSICQTGTRRMYWWRPREGLELDYIIVILIDWLMSEEAIPVKVVVVGDGAVGKTCLLISYTQNKFPTEYVPTVFDNYTATVKIDGKMINLGLWDTAGQQEYNRLRPLAYPNADVFLIVFSVVEPASFTNAIKKWYPQLQQIVADVPKIFVGNKIDQRQEFALRNKGAKDAPISKENAIKSIEQMKCKYVECSALTQEGLKSVFDEAMKTVLSKKIKPMTRKNESAEKEGGCSLI